MKRNLVDTLTNLAKNDPKLFAEFLEALHTPKEWQELLLRFQITERLAKKEPQLKISQDLGVGVATITRGSREIQNPKSGIFKFYSKKD